MRTSPAGEKLMEHHEGRWYRVRRDPDTYKLYRCPAGFPTIGIGHKITKGEPHLLEALLSDNEVWDLFQRDLRRIEAGVLRYSEGAEWTPARFDAIVSFTFNLGVGSYKSSTLRKRILAGDHEDVPNQLNRWIFSNGRKLPGLIIRRADEAALYASGEPQEAPDASKPRRTGFLSRIFGKTR